MNGTKLFYEILHFTEITSFKKSHVTNSGTDIPPFYMRVIQEVWFLYHFKKGADKVSCGI